MTITENLNDFDLQFVALMANITPTSVPLALTRLREHIGDDAFQTAFYDAIATKADSDRPRALQIGGTKAKSAGGAESVAPRNDAR